MSDRPAWCGDGRAAGRRGWPPPCRAPRRAARAAPARAGRRRASPRRASARAHRLDIDRVRHHGMIDRQRPGPAGDMPITTTSWPSSSMPAEQLRAAGPQRPVVADVARRRARRARSRRARPPRRARWRRAKDPSTSACPAVATAAPRAFGLADPLRGQQRAFDLHEMHVGRIVDAGVVPWPRAPPRRPCVDLRQAAEMLGRRAPRCGRGRSRAPGLRRPRPRARSNTSPMRRHAALGAARHHQADLRAPAPRGRCALEHAGSAPASRSRA